jgi:hypothetical protein
MPITEIIVDERISRASRECHAVKMFKATRSTNRFNKNQAVWVSFDHANHLDIYFKFRGSGRYVRGVIDKSSPVVGEIKSIDVDGEFASRITGEHQGTS